MNYNQKLLKESLDKGLKDADFTYNKYREILDVCLAALEEPAQASEPKQVDLKDLQFYFDDAYREGIANFGHNLIYYVHTGILKAVKKDKRLFGMQPSIITFDEMHTHIQPGGVFGKFKNLVQVKKNKKDEAVHVPTGAIVEPEPMKVEYVGNEWLYEKANEFRRNVLDAFRELYDNDRISFEEYADNVASIDSWRIAMNSEPKEEQLDELYKHKTNVFRQEPTVQGEIKYKRADGCAFIREAEEKDEYAAMSERLNEIADKVNKLYADVKHRIHPLVQRIDSDAHIIKSGLGLKGVKPGETKQANVNKTLDDYPLTDRQLQQVTERVTKNLNATNTTVNFTGGELTKEQTEEMIKTIQNNLVKSIRETRLKGGK